MHVWWQLLLSGVFILVFFKTLIIFIVLNKNIIHVCSVLRYLEKNKSFLLSWCHINLQTNWKRFILVVNIVTVVPIIITIKSLIGSCKIVLEGFPHLSACFQMWKIYLFFFASHICVKFNLVDFIAFCKLKNCWKSMVKHNERLNLSRSFSNGIISWCWAAFLSYVVFYLRQLIYWFFYVCCLTAYFFISETRLLINCSIMYDCKCFLNSHISYHIMFFFHFDFKFLLTYQHAKI